MKQTKPTKNPDRMSNGPFSQRIPKSFLQNDTVIIIALNRVIQAKLSPPHPQHSFLLSVPNSQGGETIISSCAEYQDYC